APNSATFHTLSWNQLSKEVRRLAAGLRRTGIKPGDRVVQVSENRYEWILLDLAVHLARGVHVAIHASLSGQQIAWQIADSGGSLVVISTAEQAKKLAADGISLPHGLRFYSYEHMEAEIGREPIIPFTDLFAGVGKDTVDLIVREAVEQTKPGDL